MTNEEREKLIEDMAKASWATLAPPPWDKVSKIVKQQRLIEARAALAIAERRIREDCAGKAKIAWLEADVGILGDADYASALCEWTSDAILASIPENKDDD